MIVHVNGEEKDLAPNFTLLQLIADLNLAPERIAAELNGLVVPRAAWPTTQLTDGDRIELVHFVGGGRSFEDDSRQARGRVLLGLL